MIDATEPRFLEARMVMTRGIAERPQCGMMTRIRMEDKHPRVQTKHGLDAAAALQALLDAGFVVARR